MSVTLTPIPATTGYFVDIETGEVWSFRRWKSGRPLKPHVRADDGYCTVSIYYGSNSTPKVERVDHLIAAAAYGPKPEGLMVLHWDDVKTNNRANNLRYGTSADNAQDRVRNGHDASLTKKQCPQGHLYTPENTKLNYLGHRQCRTCLTVSYRKAKRRQRAKARHGDK